MTQIRTDQDIVTLINIFTVRPENQQPLVDLLIAATVDVMRTLPGFVSANIHRSLDGVRLTNYAQWRSREAFETMLQNPAASAHMQAAAHIAESFEPHLYEVVSVDKAPPV